MLVNRRQRVRQTVSKHALMNPGAHVIMLADGHEVRAVLTLGDGGVHILENRQSDAAPPLATVRESVAVLLLVKALEGAHSGRIVRLHQDQRVVDWVFETHELAVSALHTEWDRLGLVGHHAHNPMNVLRHEDDLAGVRSDGVHTELGVSAGLHRRVTLNHNRHVKRASCQADVVELTPSTLDHRLASVLVLDNICVTSVKLDERTGGLVGGRGVKRKHVIHCIDTVDTAAVAAASVLDHRSGSCHQRPIDNHELAGRLEALPNLLLGHVAGPAVQHTEGVEEDVHRALVVFRRVCVGVVHCVADCANRCVQLLSARIDDCHAVAGGIHSDDTRVAALTVRASVLLVGAPAVEISLLQLGVGRVLGHDYRVGIRVHLLAVTVLSLERLSAEVLRYIEHGNVTRQHHGHLLAVGVFPLVLGLFDADHLGELLLAVAPEHVAAALTGLADLLDERRVGLLHARDVQPLGRHAEAVQLSGVRDDRPVLHGPGWGGRTDVGRLSGDSRNYLANTGLRNGGNGGGGEVGAAPGPDHFLILRLFLYPPLYVTPFR